MCGLHTRAHACRGQLLAQDVFLDCCLSDTLASLTCSHGKNSTHLSCLPAPRLHPLPVWLFSSSGYCRQSQRRFLKHLHAFHMLEPGITQVTDLFSFLYLKVWWFFFLKNAYTNISVNWYLKISGPRGSECLALRCLGCMVLGRDGRCGKSTLTWSSHEIAKCKF